MSDFLGISIFFCVFVLMAVSSFLYLEKHQMNYIINEYNRQYPQTPAAAGEKAEQENREASAAKQAGAQTSTTPATKS